jgi:hypothetical protein
VLEQVSLAGTLEQQLAAAGDLYPLLHPAMGLVLRHLKLSNQLISDGQDNVVSLVTQTGYTGRSRALFADGGWFDFDLDVARHPDGPGARAPMRSHHHDHVSAVLLRSRLDETQFLDIFGQPLQ